MTNCRNSCRFCPALNNGAIIIITTNSVSKSNNTAPTAETTALSSLGEVPACPPLGVHELCPLVRLLPHHLHQLAVLLGLLRPYWPALGRLLKRDALPLRDIVDILEKWKIDSVNLCVCTILP